MESSIFGVLDKPDHPEKAIPVSYTYVVSSSKIIPICSSKSNSRCLLSFILLYYTRISLAILNRHVLPKLQHHRMPHETFEFILFGQIHS
jgi:hypothetical protein